MGTALIMLLGAVLLLSHHFAYGAETEKTAFVSKTVPGLYVQVIFHPGPLKSAAAKEKWKQLSDGLKREFQPVTRVQQRSSGYAECKVVLRDWESGDPNFQSTCFSAAMWHEDSPLVYVDLPETVEDALSGLQTFTLNHQIRLARPSPQKFSRMSPA